MKKVILDTIQEQNRRVAEDMAEYIRNHPGALVCLAAGDTPLGAYAELVKLHKAGKVDLNSIYYVGLDEWVGLGYETRGSCMQLMYDTLYGAAGIDEERCVVWNGKCEDPQAEIRRITDFIHSHGHIDFTLLGIGMNGHIGFNEPGTGLPEGGILVDLDETTKSVSKKYFDTPLPVRLGVGVGVGAGELKKADTIYLMANEARKAQIVARVVNEPATPAVPASMLMDHANLTFYLDKDAAALL